MLGPPRGPPPSVPIHSESAEGDGAAEDDASQCSQGSVDSLDSSELIHRNFLVGRAGTPAWAMGTARERRAAVARDRSHATEEPAPRNPLDTYMEEQEEEEPTEDDPFATDFSRDENGGRPRRDQDFHTTGSLGEPSTDDEDASSYGPSESLSEKDGFGFVGQTKDLLWLHAATAKRSFSLLDCKCSYATSAATTSLHLCDLESRQPLPGPLPTASSR